MIIFDNGRIIQQISVSSIWTAFWISLSIYLVLYAFRAIGLFIMARKAKLKISCLAFIPVAWLYLVATLCGDVNFMSSKSNKFPLFVLLFCGIIEIGTFVVYTMSFGPLFSYTVNGGNLIIARDYRPYQGQFPNAWVWQMGGYFYIAVDFVSPYSTQVWNALQILNYIFAVMAIFTIFIYVVVFSNFFRRYFPNHYFIATLFSVLGFFGPFVFAIRNNTPVDYMEYVREKYNEFYGNGGGYQGGPQNNSSQNNNTNNNSNNSKDEPFDEYKDKNKDKNDKDEPFNDFK